jgi:hypothetical protein
MARLAVDIHNKNVGQPVISRGTCYFCNMTQPNPKLDKAVSSPERFLLFCVASKTEWARAGVSGATATAMMVKGLVQRDPGGELALTKRGRAVLEALLMEQDE